MAQCIARTDGMMQVSSGRAAQIRQIVGTNISRFVQLEMSSEMCRLSVALPFWNPALSVCSSARGRWLLADTVEKSPAVRKFNFTASVFGRRVGSDSDMAAFTRIGSQRMRSGAVREVLASKS